MRKNCLETIFKMGKKYQESERVMIFSLSELLGARLVFEVNIIEAQHT